jgi:hypothetical protein
LENLLKKIYYYEITKLIESGIVIFYREVQVQPVQLAVQTPLPETSNFWALILALLPAQPRATKIPTI